MVSNDTKGAWNMSEEIRRTETRQEVSSYIAKLKYALDNGASLIFQETRRVDANRDLRYSNRYAAADLFPNQNPVDGIKRVLKKLGVENYLGTVRDLRFPDRNEMREFGITIKGHGNLYIKMRVELLADQLGHTVFVMSFHYAERPFKEEDFPYRNKEGRL